jgi:hypothetical protein
MTDRVVLDERNVRQRALVVLLVADSVKREGWGDRIAAQLRQAARDLLGMAADAAATDTGAAKEAADYRARDGRLSTPEALSRW